ncbi:MAG TPA: hypothetical protein V6D50_09040 [Chroococcales cyanobacterium]|jgi:hypothetical protein
MFDSIVNKRSPNAIRAAGFDVRAILSNQGKSWYKLSCLPIVTVDGDRTHRSSLRQ